MKNKPIGFMDSGLGGLSVLLEVRKLLPQEDFEYFADNYHQPYGEKSQKELVIFTKQIITFLLSQKIKIGIIACNTATAASLELIKKEFPIPIMGVIQPAVLEAVKKTKNKKIGVIATEYTIRSKIYTGEIKKINSQIEVYDNFCPRFVPLVEEGKFNQQETYLIAQEYLKPLKEAKVDTLILGCTHYSFLKRIIARIMGSAVQLVDPANSTARVLERLLRESGLLKEEGPGKEHYYTSGSPQKIEKIASIIMQKDIKMNKVEL
ncbi:MAG: glutamate racemase [Candidatus Caldatribacteriota bacterium]